MPAPKKNCGALERWPSSVSLPGAADHSVVAGVALDAVVGVRADEQVARCASGDAFDVDHRIGRAQAIEGVVGRNEHAIDGEAARAEVDPHLGVRVDEAQGVETAAAVEDVGALVAAQPVVAGAAGDRIVAGAAVDAFDVEQRVGVAAVRYGAAAAHYEGRDNRRDERGVVRDVDELLPAAVHRVAARAAVEPVVAGVAGDVVVEAVARAEHRRAAEKHEVLDFGDGSEIRINDGSEVHGNRVAHGVDAAAGPFDDRVAAAEAVVDVVAVSAVERVGIRAAHQEVVALAAGERVVAFFAGERVVALAAVDRVVAPIPAEEVGAGIAGEPVGERTAEEILDAGDNECPIGTH